MPGCSLWVTAQNLPGRTGSEEQTTALPLPGHECLGCFLSSHLFNLKTKKLYSFSSLLMAPKILKFWQLFFPRHPKLPILLLFPKNLYLFTKNKEASKDARLIHRITKTLHTFTHHNLDSFSNNFFFLPQNNHQPTQKKQNKIPTPVWVLPGLYTCRPSHRLNQSSELLR